MMTLILIQSHNSYDVMIVYLMAEGGVSLSEVINKIFSVPKDGLLKFIIIPLIIKNIPHDMQDNYAIQLYKQYLILP